MNKKISSKSPFSIKTVICTIFSCPNLGALPVDFLNIDELIDKRGWALSTLFVDKTDKFPSNLTRATMNILHVNMLPAYGLNVHDMLKHKNLVMTKAAVEHIGQNRISIG